MPDPLAILNIETPLAVLQWMHPALAAFGLLTAGPIVIHLLTRHQRRRLVFPTVQFLSEAVASRSRLFHLRHLLLMAMRFLAIAAIVAGFAGPVWHSTAGDEARARHGAAVVVLLDASASMGHQSSPLTPMAQARNKAASLLNDLHPAADLANLIVVGAEPRPSAGQLTDNLLALRRDAEAAQATAERADWRAALALAVAQLGQCSHPVGRKQVHLISDLQRSNFADLSGVAMPGDVELIVHAVAESPPAGRVNCAVSQFELTPPAPVLGQACRLAVRVTNYGQQPARLRVSARLDELPPLPPREVTVAPYRSTQVDWPIRFNTAGWHTAQAAIDADLLAVDDTAYLTVRVLDQAPVLLVADEDAESMGASAYFLNRALAPQGRGLDRIRVHTVTASELNESQLAGMSAVLITNVGALPQRAVDALYYYTAQGGGLAYFLGPGPVADNVKLLAARSASPMPFLPGELIDHQGSSVQINYVNEQDELLAPFCREYQASLQAPRVMRHYATISSPGLRDSHVLLRYEDNTIAMARGELGAGQIVLCNFSPDPQFCDIGKREAMVVLAQQLALCLGPRRAIEPAVLVGQPASVLVDLPGSPDNLRAVRPDSLAHGGTLIAGARPMFRLDPAWQPGVYRVTLGEALAGAVAVNVDARESDLQADLPANVAARIAGANSDAWRVAATAEMPSRTGRPLWPWLLLTAAGLLAVEMLLAAFWKK